MREDNEISEEPTIPNPWLSRYAEHVVVRQRLCLRWVFYGGGLDF